jgi:hypothetical protein
MFQWYWSGGASISTNFGTFSGVGRFAGALGIRGLAGAGVNLAWSAGTYAGAMFGNIPLGPGGPTITDEVSNFIEFEANGPSGAEPPSCP